MTNGAALARAYHVVDVVDGGSISGRVLWTGPRPEPVRIARGRRTDECGTERELPLLGVGPEGGVESTLVYVEGVSAGRELPQGPFEMTFAGCELTPTLLAVPAGAEVRFRNDEPLLHNVRAVLGGEAWADLGLPRQGATGASRVPSAGLSSVVDDAAHPWIRASIHSFAHPYFAVTDETGRVQIQGVPPGRYTIRAWHDGVTVVPGELRSGRPRVSAALVLSRPVTVMPRTEVWEDFELDLAVAAAAGE